MKYGSNELRRCGTEGPGSGGAALAGMGEVTWGRLEEEECRGGGVAAFFELDEAVVAVLVGHQDGDAEDAEAAVSCDAKGRVDDPPLGCAVRCTVTEGCDVRCEEGGHVGGKVGGKFEIALTA